MDSARSDRVRVSGVHRPLRMPRCKTLQSLAVSYRGKTPPGTYCIEEFAYDNRLIELVQVRPV